MKRTILAICLALATPANALSFDDFISIMPELVDEKKSTYKVGKLVK